MIVVMVDHFCIMVMCVPSVAMLVVFMMFMVLMVATPRLGTCRRIEQQTTRKTYQDPLGP